MLSPVLKSLLGAVAFAIGWLAYRPAAAGEKPATKAPPEPGQQHPRGIRNNNPGNIRTRGTRNGIGGADPWRELIGEDDEGYGIWPAPVWGIRPMFRELETGLRRDGENTIRAIIAEWAPPTENNTAAYIASVVSQTGMPADLPMSEDDFPRLVKAIIRHENGRQPYSDELIQQARALA